MKILEIQASPGITSVSLEVSRQLLKKIQALHVAEGSEVQIVTRHLEGEHAPPHWGSNHVQASFTPPEARTLEQSRSLALSDLLCREVIEADVLIIASPMWNFTIPSALKAWIDHVVRVGVTFRYGAHGPEGLVSLQKKLYLVQASGGSYTNSPMNAYDHVSPYLRQIFGFLGVQDVTIIRAENTALDRANSLKDAFQVIHDLQITL